MQYPIGPHKDTPVIRTNQEACKDHTEVIPSNDRICVLADRYSVANLHQLALHRLHKTLGSVTLSGDRVSDITILLSLSCDDTPDRMRLVDKLRLLVVK